MKAYITGLVLGFHPSMLLYKYLKTVCVRRQSSVIVLILSCNLYPSLQL